jgi:hypothetical protein
MSQGVRVHRIPASKIYHDLGGATDAVLVQAEALIDAERSRLGLAPSTTRSSLRSASGPPCNLESRGSVKLAGAVAGGEN